MKYRRLGSTGLQVSEIGFGTWGIGGNVKGAIAYGPTDDAESRRALARAFENGVNFYDTADLYGYGHSEILLGKVFKKLRGKIVIASKVGFLTPESQSFTPKHIKQSIIASLKRLQTDYVDLYQLHNPPLDLLEQDERILATLDSIKKEGKIRAIGISVRSPEDGLKAVQKFDVSCLQVNFNMVDQRAFTNGLFGLCKERKVGLICRTPLCFGFLGDAYSESRPLDAQDHRRSWAPEQRKLWSEARLLFLSAIRDQKGTAAQTALRFCLSYRAISTVIPGMLTRREVDENILASTLGPLKKADLMKIQEIYRTHTFFLGKKEVPRHNVRVTA